MNPYWTTARLPTATELEEGCRIVARMIKEGRSDIGKKKAREASELLFGLSRIGLPDVRANLFWPEVARELRARSGVDIPEGNVATLYRGWLAEAYAASIDWGTHHKYVGLVFEQAGIGSGRGRIIRDFLRHLVDALGDRKAGADNREIVRATFRTFEEEARSTRSEAAGDIPPLRNVLLRAGYAVADFAEFIRDYPRKWLLATWEWAKVKQVWHEASGVDPETLTPSAQDVLQEIVSWLAKSVTRREIFRALKEGALSVELPDPLRAEEAADWMDLPIGPARLRGAFGDAVVEVVDHPALPAAALLNSRFDEWLSHEDVHYQVSDREFTATLANGRVRASVPLLVGKNPERAVQRAFYCGLDSPPCEDRQRPSPEGVKKRRPVQDRLFLDWALFYDPVGVKLRLRSFKISDATSAAKACLKIGPKVVWEGGMEGGVPAGWSSVVLSVLPEHLEGDRIFVAYKDDEEAEYSIRLSLRELWQPAFLVSRGRLVREHTVSSVDPKTPVEANLYVAEGVEPRSENAKLVKSGETTFAGRRFVRYSIALFDGAATSLVRARAREWRFIESVSFSTEVAIPTECQFGNVTCSAAGPLRVAGRGGSIVAVLHPSSPWNETPDYLKVHVGGAVDLKLPVGQTTIKADADRWTVDVGQLLEMNGVRARDELTFGIGAWDSNPEETFTVAIIDAAKGQPCRLDDIPSVMLKTMEGDIRSATARDPVTQSSIAEGKKAIAFMDFGAGRAWLTWPPAVEDVALNGHAGTRRGYRIGAANLKPGPIVLGAYGPPGEAWSVTLGTSVLEVASGSAIEIGDAVAAARTGSAEGPILISARKEATEIAWELLDTVAVGRLLADWQPAVRGVAKLGVSAKLTGLVPNVVRFAVIGSGRSLSEQTVVVGEAAVNGVGEVEVGCQLVLPATTAAFQDLALILEHRGLVVGNVQLPRPEHVLEVGGPSVTAEEIAEALKQFRESGSVAFAEQAITLMAHYVASRGELPYQQDRLLAPVINARATHPGVRNLMVNCIRLLGATKQDEVQIVPEYHIGETQIITLILATLVIFQQARFIERGWMDPRTVGIACQQLSTLADTGPSGWRTWCAAVGAFATFVTESGDAVDEQCRVSWGEDALPLAGLSPHFRTWLEEKQRTHDHKQ
jgi:hypothetical protein